MLFLRQVVAVEPPEDISAVMAQRKLEAVGRMPL